MIQFLDKYQTIENQLKSINAENQQKHSANEALIENLNKIVANQRETIQDQQDAMEKMIQTLRETNEMHNKAVSKLKTKLKEALKSEKVPSSSLSARKRQRITPPSPPIAKHIQAFAKRTKTINSSHDRTIVSYEENLCE